jgi:hypothetical protein
LIDAFGEGFTESDYAEYCVRELNGTHIALRYIYKIALLFHEYIPFAIRWKVFDIGDEYDKSIEQLIEKVTALQEHFRHACRVLDKPEQDLTWDSESSGLVAKHRL